MFAARAAKKPHTCPPPFANFSIFHFFVDPHLRGYVSRHSFHGAFNPLGCDNGVFRACCGCGNQRQRRYGCCNLAGEAE